MAKQQVSDETQCDKVAAALRDRGITARAEHTGGGIWCVMLPTMDGGEWCFGMADVHWAGGYSDKDSGYLDRFYVTTTVKSDAPHASAVANAINTILTPFVGGAAFVVIGSKEGK
jgi:hypothetical protein